MTGRRLWIASLLLLSALPATAEQPSAVRDTVRRDTVRNTVRAYRQAHEKQIVGELTDLLALPNVATRLQDVERNAGRLTALLERRGFKVQRLSAGEGTPPSVYGELSVPGAKRTVMFYAHYDGQPVGQKGWLSDPFKPVLRSGVLGAPRVKEIDPASVLGTVRPGVADLRPLGERRQVADHRHADRAGRPARRGNPADGQRQAVPGRRGGAGVRAPAGDPAAPCRFPRRRRLAALRRAGPSDAEDGGLLRRPRRGRAGAAPSTARSGPSTAGTTATGRPIRRWSWCSSWPVCATRRGKS